MLEVTHLRIRHREGTDFRTWVSRFTLVKKGGHLGRKVCFVIFDSNDNGPSEGSGCQTSSVTQFGSLILNVRDVGRRPQRYPPWVLQVSGVSTGSVDLAFMTGFCLFFSGNFCSVTVEEGLGHCTPLPRP